jgi:hypothetical protein
MADYLERYMRGEYEQVWSDLLALGPAVREEPHWSGAEQVAAEMMARVRRNCETLITRLEAMGYDFARYPDGSRRYGDMPPHTPPAQAMRSAMLELEEAAGPLPLSLRAFWNVVGAVDLVGMGPGWPDGLDPLVVDPPEGALAWIYDSYEEDEGVFAALAPDDLHKDNVSGGDPYGVLLPQPAVDCIFENEPHGLHFVDYLRFAILKWGGFPGLEGSDTDFKPLGELTRGMEAF